MKYFLIANNLFGYFRQLQAIYFGLSRANNLFQCLRLCKQFISKVFISPLPHPQNKCAVPYTSGLEFRVPWKTRNIYTRPCFGHSNIGCNRTTQEHFSVTDSLTQTARLILRERVDFARQQRDRNRQNRAATADSHRQARGVATRDSGSGQVQSTKLDRTWVLLHFI